MICFGEIDHEVQKEWSKYLTHVCFLMTPWEHLKLALAVHLFSPLFRLRHRFFSTRAEYILLCLLWLFVLGNHREAKEVVDTMFEIRREIHAEHFIADEEEITGEKEDDWF